MVLEVILCGMCLQNNICPLPSVFDFTFTIRGDILDQYIGAFSLAPEPSIVIAVDPGTYAFFGNVDFRIGSLRASSDSSDRAPYPSSLYLKLVKSTLVSSGGIQTTIDTDAIEIKLKVNSKTGEIPSQNIKVVNQLIADPAKNESIKFQIRTERGKISAGKKIQIGYTKEGG